MMDWNNELMSEWREDGEEGELYDQNELSRLPALLLEDGMELEELSALLSQYVMLYVCKEPRRTSDNYCIKRQKLLASKKITDAISRIATTSKHRIDAINKFMNHDGSIDEVMTELRCMEEIVCDPDLHRRCCHLMLYKPLREMFVALRGHRESLVNWLRNQAYNPPGFVLLPES